MGLIDKLNAIANAIRKKTGKAEKLTLDEMPLEIESIVSGGEITFDDIATSSLTGDINLSVASVSSYAFANCDSIKSVYAPNVTKISNYGFYHTGGITDIYFPKLVTIGEYCLSYLAITTLDLPECTTIGASSFNKCTKITSINLPKVTAIPNTCLAETLISSVVLPEATSIGNSSLSNSKNLTYVDLPKCKSFSSYVLRNSSKFATLILRADSVCTLGSNALNSTAISKGTGYVYVPSALIASYQAATNWVKIYNTNNNVFRALEDYTVDGTITGELDETKI